MEHSPCPPVPSLYLMGVFSVPSQVVLLSFLSTKWLWCFLPEAFSAGPRAPFGSALFNVQCPLLAGLENQGAYSTHQSPFPLCFMVEPLE